MTPDEPGRAEWREYWRDVLAERRMVQQEHLEALQKRLHDERQERPATQHADCWACEAGQSSTVQALLFAARDDVITAEAKKRHPEPSS